MTGECAAAPQALPALSVVDLAAGALGVAQALAAGAVAAAAAVAVLWQCC